MKASSGYRAKTRRKFKKGPRDKFTVEAYLREFKEGDRVIIKVDSASQKSMPHSRYHGTSGIVREKRGRGYVVETSLGNKKVMITTRPEHLKGA
jgi:large subunit ribosomal protein L21e